MSVIHKLVTGDDSVLPVQLNKNDAPFVIDTGAEVKASIISKDRKTVLIPPVAVLEATAGSSWINSEVVVSFTEAETLAIPTSYYDKSVLLEIQVNDGGKLTWFLVIKIVQGTIT